ELLDLGVHQLEAHQLLVEAMSLVDVAAGVGHVMKPLRRRLGSGRHVVPRLRCGCDRSGPTLVAQTEPDVRFWLTRKPAPLAARAIAKMSGWSTSNTCTTPAQCSAGPAASSRPTRSATTSSSRCSRPAPAIASPAATG